MLFRCPSRNSRVSCSFPEQGVFVIIIIMEKRMDEKVYPPTSSTLIKPQAREPYDSGVSFEEYTYYAQKTRAEQELLAPPVLNMRQWFGKSSGNDSSNQDVTTALTEEDFTNRARRLEITDEEWTNASRAFRSASWGAC
jgi:hypothetical protein